MIVSELTEEGTPVVYCDRPVPIASLNMSDRASASSRRKRLSLILLLAGEILLVANVVVDRQESSLLILLVVSVVALPLALGLLQGHEAVVGLARRLRQVIGRRSGPAL